MSEDIFTKQRKENLEKLKSLGIDPYPSDSERTNQNKDIKEDFKKLEGKTVTVVGRIMARRGHGKICFMTIRDESGDGQLFFRYDNFGDDYDKISLLDIGDFIQANGVVFKTKAGEESLEVKKWSLLSKALRPLPEKWHGLKDVETRYRKRYLDFLTNPEIKEKIVTKSKIVDFIREFLKNKNFIEVFTPVLEMTPSGAAAKPFATHLDAYDMDMYMRICIGELWQKMLMVGNFEKTFEIGYAFRNEGVDFSHNPEFLNCEFYWAYATYKDLIKITEEMTSELVKKIKGSHQITYQGKKIDFTPPYPVISFRDVVKKYTKIDIDDFPEKEDLKKELSKHDFKIDPKAGRGKILDDFYKDKVRPHLDGPIFIIDHPIEISPLAKTLKDDPTKVQRVQLLVAGQEIFNGYSELNDPIDQKDRFEEQANLLKEGDQEAFRADDHFVEALEYGMPPTAGHGIGIERLTMLLTDSAVMREIITFPIMKPDKN